MGSSSTIPPPPLTTVVDLGSDLNFLAREEVTRSRP